MLIPLGEMREVAVLLTPVMGVDEFGGEEITYVESHQFFIALRSVTATEAVQFGQVNSSVNYIAFGHWTDLAGVVSNQRLKIVETGIEYDITGPPINSPDRDWSKLQLVARENG